MYLLLVKVCPKFLIIPVTLFMYYYTSIKKFIYYDSRNLIHLTHLVQINKNQIFMFTVNDQ